MPSLVHEVLRSPGQPLEEGTRAFMGERLGHDFSRVRVHADTKASESARAVGARAYTVGRDIVFEAAHYRPSTDTGRRLLAHELTHVLQQEGASAGAGLRLGPTGDRFEREAAAASRHPRPAPVSARAERVLAREPAEPSGTDTAARFQAVYAYLNGLEIKHLLKTARALNGMGYFPVLLEHLSQATGVNASRLFVVFQLGSLQQNREEDALREELKSHLANIPADQVEALFDLFTSTPLTAPTIAPSTSMPDVSLVKHVADTADLPPVALVPDEAPKQPAGATAAPASAGAAKGDAAVLERVRAYDTFIEEASKEYGIPADRIRAIIATESGGKPEATSGAAYGLMQLTKDTWKGRQKADPKLESYDFDTSWQDPRTNILFGTAELKAKMGSLGIKTDSPHFARLAVVAYNAGQGTVLKAMEEARNAGSTDPEADCLKPEYLKPAIKATGIYSYYLTNKKGEPRTEEEAIDLKYKEISAYPTKVGRYEQLLAAGPGAGAAAAPGAAPGAAPSAPAVADTPAVHELEATKKATLVKESDEAKTRAIEEAPAVYVKNILTNAGFNYDTWLKDFVNTTFLGVSITPSIHKEFAAILKTVEQRFANLYGGPSKSPKEAGKSLDVRTVGGSRSFPTCAAISSHLFGLAIDVNYTANPFVSPDSSNRVFPRAGVLVNGAEMSLKGSNSFDELQKMDSTLVSYFALMDDVPRLKAHPNLRAFVERYASDVRAVETRNNKKKKLSAAEQKRVDTAEALARETDVGVLAESARTIISDDLTFLAGKWERAKDKELIKKGGFFDLNKDFVEGMIQGTGLDWGGGSYGDMMHFDWRNSGNGAKVNKAINSYKKDKEAQARKAYAEESEEDRKARREAEKAAREAAEAERKKKAAEEAKSKGGAKKKKK